MDAVVEHGCGRCLVKGQNGNRTLKYAFYAHLAVANGWKFSIGAFLRGEIG